MNGVRGMNFFRARLRVIGICIAIIALFAAGPGVAAPTPEGTVQEMLTRLKQERDPAVMLQYVHWQSAFDNFPSAQRQEMGVDSPAAFQKYFENFFKDPSHFMREQLRGRLDALPENQRAAVQSQMDHMVQMFAEKRKEMDEKMGRTEYTIGSVDKQGNAATVEITSSLDGNQRTQRIPLEFIDGRWYLPTMKFVQDKAGALPE